MENLKVSNNLSNLKLHSLSLDVGKTNHLLLTKVQGAALAHSLVVYQLPKMSLKITTVCQSLCIDEVRIE